MERINCLSNQILSNQTSGVWDHLKVAPPDPILGTALAYKADKNPKKMNLGIGAYRDNNEKPYVFQVVRQAETILAQQTSDGKLDKEYLPIDGLAQFNLESQKLIFGADSQLLKEKRVVTLQSLSGTGSLRLGFEFVKKFIPSNVYVSNPTWGNHNSIIANSGLNVIQYPYYKPSTRGLDFEGMMATLSKANAGSVILLHACAHNPTGVDLTIDQWSQLAELFQARKLIAFFDSAYQGYASGSLEQDIQSVRLFVNRNIQVILTQSYAKNFGLYGERVGAIHITAPSAQEAQKVMSQIKLIARAIYSNPPIHGARLVALVLSNPQMKAQWEKELKEIAGRILQMRALLRKKLEEIGVKGKWNHITDQIGMFSYTGLSTKQCEVLINKYSIYLLKNGRISMAGITTNNVDYLANAIKDAVNNS